ncbi:MAG: hypothetical protein IJ641_04300, partial [Lachnospiraceae bacterium]|nr:hypothetical protein [Lachnospiraceae bacterium]
MRKHLVILLILAATLVPQSFVYADDNTEGDSTVSQDDIGSVSEDITEIQSDKTESASSVSNNINDDKMTSSSGDSKVSDGETGISENDVLEVTENKGDSSNGFEYTGNTDGTVTITKYSGGGSGDLTIPSTLGGKKVTAIDNSAIYGGNFSGNLTIPSSITSIASDAFYSFYYIKTVQNGSSEKINVSCFIDSDSECLENNSNSSDWKVNGEKIGKGTYTRKSLPSSDFEYKI